MGLIDLGLKQSQKSDEIYLFFVQINLDRYSMRVVIPGTIHQGNFVALKQLMRDWSSCARYAYQRIHKDGLTGNAVKVACKPFYMKRLNQRYIADAVLKVQAIKKDHVIFGGEKTMERFTFWAPV